MLSPSIASKLRNGSCLYSSVLPHAILDSEEAEPTSLAWMPHRDQVKRLLIGRQRKDTFNLPVVEGANQNTA